MRLEGYPMLDSAMLPKLHIMRSPLSAAGCSGDEEVPIECIPENAGPFATAWQLESPSWHPETSDLVLNYELTISLPLFLFGPYGLAPSEDSVLGLAVQWSDADASQRGVFQLGELSSKDRRQPWHLHKKIEFQRGLLRGMLRLSLILYLKKAGTPAPQEQHLARLPGTVFGIIHEDRLIIDGNGSTFPVRHISDSNAPLWQVVCDWQELTDPVNEETFCFELNQAHPDYPALYTGEGDGWTPMMREVLAGVFEVLITKAVSDADGPLYLGQDLQEGSIGQWVAYLLEIYELNVDKTTVRDDPEVFAADLRRAFYKNMYDARLENLNKS